MFGVLTTVTLALGATPAAARYKVRHKPEHKKIEHVSKDPFGDIPNGPLQIFISIDQQKLHLYSDGVHVADTSIATGVPSLPTPLGVFSVIQKQVFHRSNIYSGAPMPFMQRITWSGVAMHEGEGIGHRASHGCIRMPHDFAVRLYHLTKLGVPVVIARSELKPVEFADPHLFAHRAKPPQQIEAVPPVSSTQPPAATPADAAPPASPGTPNPAALGLRVSADSGLVPSNVTADARKPDATVNDAATSAAPPAPPPAALTHAAAPSDRQAEKPAPDAMPDAAKPDAVTESGKSAAADAAATSAAVPSEQQPDPPAPPAAADATKPDGAVADAAKSAAPAAVVASAAAPSDQHPDPPAPVAARSDSVPTPPVEPAALVQEAPLNKDPIAIFISRKEKKIYVRQDFTPLFQAPVTIADPDQPFGTQVFTAMDFVGDDHATLRWNVVSFPAEPLPRQKVEREKRYERYGRGRRRTDEDEKLTFDAPPPQTPAQVLARIEIPQAAIDFISQLIVPGSSLIVSDHGLGDETGEGTNFVVVTR